MRMLSCLALFVWAWEKQRGEGRMVRASSSCIHRCSCKNILIHMFPSTCLFPGNLALQHEKKMLLCFHTNKAISNHYKFLLCVAYRQILEMILPPHLICNSCMGLWAHVKDDKTCIKVEILGYFIDCTCIIDVHLFGRAQGKCLRYSS